MRRNRRAERETHHKAKKGEPKQGSRQGPGEQKMGSNKSQDKGESTAIDCASEAKAAQSEVQSQWPSNVQRKEGTEGHKKNGNQRSMEEKDVGIPTDGMRKTMWLSLRKRKRTNGR